VYYLPVPWLDAVTQSDLYIVAAASPLGEELGGEACICVVAETWEGDDILAVKIPELGDIVFQLGRHPRLYGPTGYPPGRYALVRAVVAGWVENWPEACRLLPQLDEALRALRVGGA